MILKMEKFYTQIICTTLKYYPTFPNECNLLNFQLLCLSHSLTIEIWELITALTASTAEVHCLCVLGFILLIVVYVASVIDLLCNSLISS